MFQQAGSGSSIIGNRRYLKTIFSGKKKRGGTKIDGCIGGGVDSNIRHCEDCRNNLVPILPDMRRFLGDQGFRRNTILRDLQRKLLDKNRSTILVRREARIYRVKVAKIFLLK